MPCRVEAEAVLRETEHALLVSVEGEEVWIPKSVIDEDSECYSMKSGAGTLIVADWFGRKQGWD